jgi:hypothetical protein
MIMILKPGEKIHVIHRQLYDGDARRHFVGTVDACDGTLARVGGYLFAMDTKSNQFIKRDTLRTRIIPLDSAAVIVNVLPEKVQIEKIAYKYRPAGDILVTDGSDWHLDLTHL